MLLRSFLLPFSFNMDTRGRKRRMAVAADNLRNQVGAKRLRRGVSTNDNIDTTVQDAPRMPTQGNTVEAGNTVPPSSISSMVDNISSAIVSQLKDTVRKEVTEHLTSIGMIVPTGISNLELGETSNISHQSTDVSVNSPVNSTVNATVSVTSAVNSNSGTSTSNQVSVPALSLDIAHSSNPQNKSSFTSVSLPLHATVDQKIREKIWANEYVELSTIFSDDLRFTSNISLNFTDTGASVVTNPRKRFMNIEQWTDAFAKYSSVMRIKYPESADALAQYSATVRSIAKSNGNWHYYDTQFRKLRQTTPMAWDVIQHELYFRSLNQNTSFHGRQGFQSQGFRNQGFQTQGLQNQNFLSQNSTSRKVCFKFNRGEHCAGCAFQHACSHCGGVNHAVFKCFKLRKSEQGSRGQQTDSSNLQSDAKKSDSANNSNKK